MTNANESGNPWRTLESRPIYDNPWISVREDQVIRPDGKPGIYGVVHYKNIATGVVPLHDDGTVTLVGQYRYTLEEYAWEIPEGGCPAGEEPLEAAKRELLEETGLTAREWRRLGSRLHLSNSVSDEYGFLFLATGLEHGEAQPEGTEDLRVKRVPLEEAVRMAVSGEITDCLSVIGLLLAAAERK